MTSSTGTVPGYDRTPLFTRRWAPDGEAARAAVALAHGYAEHCGRYAPMAEALAAHGIALHTYDQRGFGHSGGPTAFVHAFDEYVADFHCFVKDVRRRTEGLLFLMGHSMGGAVAALYCLDHGARPAGLILSSPMLRLPTPRALQEGSLLTSRVAPALPTIHLERGAISRDSAVVDEALRDPLNYTGRIKAGTGAAMIRATRRIEAQMERLTVPFLVFHGTGDRLTDPAGSRALYRRARSTDKTLTLYEGFYHETFNDPGGERILEDLAAWLSERIA